MSMYKLYCFRLQCIIEIEIRLIIYVEFRVIERNWKRVKIKITTVQKTKRRELERKYVVFY